MADRLDELRKQRALVQQHLTWLDHEIAAVTVTRLTLPPFAMRGTTRPPVPVPGTGTNPATPPKTGTTRSPLTGAVIPELADFQVDPDNVHGDTRRGCILYAAIAFLVLVGVCAIIYFVGYRDRPVLFVPEKAAPTMVYPSGAPKPPPPATKPPPPPNQPPAKP